MRDASPADKSRALRDFPALRRIEAELVIYETLLRKWQAKINLVGPSTLDQIWWRHFADSAQLLAFATDARMWVDLGSGGGFPGLVLALLLKKTANAEVTLVESDSRKAAFLREVSRETSAPAVVLNQRMEALDIIRPDVVTSRALAPVASLTGAIRPWLDQGTTGLFLAGESGVDMANATLGIEATPSRTGPGFVVKVQSTDSGLS